MTSETGRNDLQVHAEWRPEWTTGRVCLCWYLVFGEDLLASLGPHALEVVRRTEWLDAVPAPWLHVTLGDVGFADALGSRDVERVLADGRRAAADLPQMRLGFGAAAPMEDAVALPVQPPEQVRYVQQRLLAVTERALGPNRDRAHRSRYRPHLSLGYVNRRVDADEAADFFGQIGDVSGEVAVDHLVLAAVTRGRTHYEWSVVDDLGLGQAQPRG